MSKTPTKCSIELLQSTSVTPGVSEDRTKEASPQQEDPRKPDVSYIEMIARAILASPERKLCLQDIYETIEKSYPYFRTALPGWRNSVRHNLSLHECFFKGERCENGKGHYWCIHPANQEDFQRGDFRRRLVKARIRRMQAMSLQCHPYAPKIYCSYPPTPLQYYTGFGGAMPCTIPVPCVYYPPSSVLPVPVNGYPAVQSRENTGSFYHGIRPPTMEAHQHAPVSQSYATSASTSAVQSEGKNEVFSVKNILSTQ